MSEYLPTGNFRWMTDKEISKKQGNVRPTLSKPSAIPRPWYEPNESP